MGEILFKAESYAIVGACFEVYKDKGCGFVEGVYQECLAIEFAHRDISFVAQQELDLFYRSQRLSQTYKPDFVCFEQIIIEIKSVQNVAPEHRAQVMNYLKATGYDLGILVNFGHFPGLEYERIVSSRSARLQGHTFSRTQNE